MTHFESDLGGLRQRLLTMASHAANAVRAAMKALADRDDEYCAQVEQQDSLIDDFEKEVDDQAIQLLLKAPLARDLRFIVMATKIGHDLERVGDEATAIARRARKLNAEPDAPSPVDLPRMAALVLDLLAQAIEAFVAVDSERARAVIPRDKEVDQLNREFTRELTQLIATDPARLTRGLALMSITRRLERIGDHAKNIAEEVVYLCEARDIRHSRAPSTS